MSALGYSIAQGLVPARNASQREADGSLSPARHRLRLRRMPGGLRRSGDGLVFAIQQCVNEARYLFCPIGTASLYPR